MGTTTRTGPVGIPNRIGAATESCRFRSACKTLCAACGERGSPPRHSLINDVRHPQTFPEATFPRLRCPAGGTTPMQPVTERNEGQSVVVGSQRLCLLCKRLHACIAAGLMHGLGGISQDL